MLQSISFVLPAFNEEANIEAMLRDAVTALENLSAEYEIVVANDGSRDATADIVRRFSLGNDRVSLVEHRMNQGYGAAVLTGLAAANYELVFFTDSDRQFDLAELAKMVELIEGRDLVIGYRAPRRDPLMRRLKGKAWSSFVNLVFGRTARDVDCAFKLMRHEVIEHVVPAVRSRGLAFSAEFLVRCASAGFKSVEMPVRGHRPREAGYPTAVGIKSTARAFVELFEFRSTLNAEAIRSQSQSTATVKKLLHPDLEDQ